MRLWKKAAVHVSVAALPLQTDKQRFAAEARADGVRRKAAFDIATARMARDAATPALGKGSPPASRAGL